MDDQEFEEVSRFQYKLKKEKPKVGYKYSPRKQVRLQMALMYELLGYKDPINFEEKERMEKAKEL